MDKEDCIQVLLATLQQPLWKSCDSVTDWDLKSVLWRAGLLLTPEQVAALFADIKRRGLITAQERRSEDRIVALWAAKITPAGEEWLAHREGPTSGRQQSMPAQDASAEETPSTEEPSEAPEPADSLFSEDVLSLH